MLSPNTKAFLPLTPRGVAGFARAPLRRLLLAQLVVAAFVAAATVWFFHTAWFPTIREAIRQLPARGEIRSGTLEWLEDDPRLLAGGRFLALAVDPAHSGRIRSPAQLQVEFGKSDVRFISVFGYADCGYPKRSVVMFNRAGLEPWWGAWGLPILCISFAAMIGFMMVVWALLATICLLPVWLAGYFLNRELNAWASWKLAGAAWLPGNLLLIAGILACGFEWLDLMQFMAAVVVHLIVGAVYVFTSPILAPALSSGKEKKRNPFARR